MNLERGEGAESLPVDPEHFSATSNTRLMQVGSTDDPLLSYPGASENAWQLQAMFEQATVGFTFTDLDGRLRNVNQRFCDIVGYSREELLGVAYRDITYPDDWSRNHTYLQKLLNREPHPSTIEKRYLRKDGSLVWTNLSVSLVRDAAGTPHHFLAIIEDITARRQMEAERAQLLQREQAARAVAETATRRLQALLTITDTTLGALPLDDLMHLMLARIRELMVVDNCAILLTDEAGQFLTVRAALGPEEEAAPFVRVPVGKGFAGTIAARAQPLIVSDLSKVEVVTALLREKLRSLLGVPLLVEGHVIGVVHVGTMSAREFSEEDVHLLQRVADRVALAIDHTRMYEAEQRAHAEAITRAKQLEATFEAIADGVVVCDAQGDILQMNAEARKLLAFEALPGGSSDYPHTSQERGTLHHFRDEQGQPLTPDQFPLVRLLNGEALNGSNPIDLLLQALDGRDVQLEISGALVRDEKGNANGVVMVLRDVTARRQLEQRTHDALQALLHMAETLVLAPADPAQLEQSQEHAESEVAKRLAELTCNVLGCQRVSITTIDSETELLRAQAVVGLTPDQERQWWAEQEQQQARLGDTTMPELVERLRANEVLLLDLTQFPFNEAPNPYGIRVMLAAPMCLGRQLVGLLTLDYGGAEHEYTPDDLALAGAVAKLAGLVIERERLLRERAEARANEIALREANRRMDEFLGIASHELKTPLAAMKGNIQLAARRLHRMVCYQVAEGQHISTNDFLRDLLESADHQSRRLNRLVNDLLDVTRIQTSKLEIHLERCDLLAIVRDAVQEQRLISPNRLISLEVGVEEPLPVIADADRIGQVVMNYLNNALKYSSEDKPVAVSLDMKDHIAQVAVRDQGVGLPLGEEQLIWQRFHQVKSVEVQSGSGVGLGLGLYISKIIVESHGGAVGVQSTSGQGSTFWFTLPLAS